MVVKFDEVDDAICFFASYAFNDCRWSMISLDIMYYIMALPQI